MNRANVIPGFAAAGCLLAASAVLAQDGCKPEWSSVGGGADWFTDVEALTTFKENQPVPPLFAGGGFRHFAGLETNALARWDGWSASPVGGGFGTASEVLDLLAAPAEAIPGGLYVSGAFVEVGDVPVECITRWDGFAWHDVQGGLTSPGGVFGFAMCLYDEDGDGPLPPYLYVGGQFQFAGGVPAVGLARWDGQTWSAVGGGLDTGNPNTHPTVYSLGVFDDGRGPALYVGGSFSYADGTLAVNIARWDGQRWESMDVGLNSVVHTLCVYDEDGPGPKKPALFAGGSFNWGGGGDGQRIWHIARWDGQRWNPVGGWLSDGSVFASAVWKSPDDQRENLYIGGTFNILPDLTDIKGIARWDGQAWREVDYGVSGFGEGTQVSALAPFDEDGDGPNPGGLYVGGMFHDAGTKGVQSYHIARWGCPLAPRCEADLDHNGALDLFDFLAFINLFNADDPAADCTGDGAFDLFDFLCFVNAFNAGC